MIAMRATTKQNDTATITAVPLSAKVFHKSTSRFGFRTTLSCIITAAIHTPQAQGQRKAHRPSSFLNIIGILYGWRRCALAMFVRRTNQRRNPSQPHKNAPSRLCGGAFGERFFLPDAVAQSLIQGRAVPAPPWFFTDDTVIAHSTLETYSDCSCCCRSKFRT